MKHRQPSTSENAFFIREIPVDNDVILAPMDGFSDYPFRSICRKLGSGLSYTEFVRAEDVLKGNKQTQQKLYYAEDERPVIFQLYGDNSDTLVKEALHIQKLNPDMIDINMGCPTKSVTQRGAGAGLLRTPIKIARLFRRLTAVLDVPVSAKMRIGWDDDYQPYKLIAKIVEENGGALLAVHGRTKKQGYHGRANWDAIAEIRQIISIPLLGNGDVRTVADIERMKSYTGCDGVMVGRGAIANPWIFSRRERHSIPPEEVYRLMRLHLKRNVTFYGEDLGVILFRKNAVQYLAPYSIPREKRKRLLTSKTLNDFLNTLEEIYQLFMVKGNNTKEQIISLT